MQAIIDNKLRCHVDCMNWQPLLCDMLQRWVRKLDPFRSMLGVSKGHWVQGAKRIELCGLKRTSSKKLCSAKSLLRPLYIHSNVGRLFG